MCRVSAIAACCLNSSNAMQDVPLAVLTATICCYWIGVGVMIVRVRRETRRNAGPVGEQRFERFSFMWLVWVPLVTGWIIVPWATLARSAKVPALPDFATSEPVYA